MTNDQGKLDVKVAAATGTELPEIDEKAQMNRMIEQVSKELQISAKQIRTTMNLLDEGNTIPFIARYRKEMTGELDETQLRNIDERMQYLRNLEVRKQEVLRLIHEQGKLTDELTTSIMEASKLQEVEDLYRPYKQKRKTRASAAKEKGLEPLSDWILTQPAQADVAQEAAKYINEEMGVTSEEEALQGALDIIAENISDDAKIRAWVRQATYQHGILHSEAKDAEQESVYEMYYQYQEPVRKLPPHRVLAINRGEREEVLRVKLEAPVERIIAYIRSQWVKGPSAVESLLQEAIDDAYKRLIAPSIEREVRTELTETAEEKAIEVFAENLRSLLLQPPVRGKTVLGVDPAFRTGCKLGAVDETGKLLEVDVIYPTPPHSKIAESRAKVKQFVEKYDIDLIVIGNGTASRETEQFIADFFQEEGYKDVLQYLIVNEAGASVYSASAIAQEEFPDFDVSERSAISIARRVQDPLAELVKIDPKAIGVGQYQHDVSQKRLAESLGHVVESVVNHVGVDLNTASPSLLSYVAGISSTIAKNIVKYREENGKFESRKELQKVPRLGSKTFEQCAGFIRIPDGKVPLDNTPIHPEVYDVATRLLAQLGLDESQLGSEELRTRLQSLDVEETAKQLDVGVPTLKDMIDSLQKPGRDPRDELQGPIFRSDVLQLEDLKPGMELKGTVRNVIDFGAFVDIGLKNDGLVHISELSDRFVKHPLDVVSVGDTVTVWVLSVDEKRGRVSLTMKKRD